MVRSQSLCENGRPCITRTWRWMVSRCSAASGAAAMSPTKDTLTVATRVIGPGAMRMVTVPSGWLPVAPLTEAAVSAASVKAGGPITCTSGEK
ncbi:hypothetical protein FQZ97_933560 [compost metagenome]